MLLTLSSVLKNDLHRTFTRNKRFILTKFSTNNQIKQFNKLNDQKVNFSQNKIILSKLYSTNTIQNHDHSKLWVSERILSLTLLGIIPVSFIFPSNLMDYLLALSLITHIHWGIEAIVIDYIRPNIFGKNIPKLSIGLTYLISILSLVGIFYFNYLDVGLSQAIKMFISK